MITILYTAKNNTATFCTFYAVQKHFVTGF